jgi:hypothetical protein
MEKAFGKQPDGSLIICVWKIEEMRSAIGSE